MTPPFSSVSKSCDPPSVSTPPSPQLISDKSLNWSAYERSMCSNSTIWHTLKDSVNKTSLSWPAELMFLVLFFSDLSLDITDTLNNNDSLSAAGGKPTEYLSLAKKGGGHQGTTVCYMHDN